jgi:hypothetical protein
MDYWNQEYLSVIDKTLSMSWTDWHRNIISKFHLVDLCIKVWQVIKVVVILVNNNLLWTYLIRITIITWVNKIFIT